MFCQECPKRSECKAICPELEKELPKIEQGRIGRHRKLGIVGEFYFKPEIMERILDKMSAKRWKKGEKDG